MSDHVKEIMLKRARDASLFSPKAPLFIGFFDEFDSAAAECSARKNKSNFCSFGGFEGSTRRILGFFPTDTEPDSALFPIIRLTASFYGDRELSHKDFLGALINGGIKREAIGDIFVGKTSADIFVKSKVASYITENLTYVGGSSVKFTENADHFNPPQREYEELSFTLSSYRADAVAAAAAGVSRSRSLELISGGRVFVNGLLLESPVKQINDQDIISIRGSGKYRICLSGEKTKKGRYKLNVKKYK